MKICAICRAKWRGTPSVCPLDGGPLEELPDPLLGRTIAGRYVISVRIGAGGMGTVYRASDGSRDVAIKFLAPELALDATNRQRFLREARAANRIDHEHIIDINDFGETEDGLVYLVMEYLDGPTLAQALSRGAFSPRRAVEIAMQIASALARAHELDVIHRDIKPANVVLTRREDGADFVKLLDFGLAKMKGEIQLTLTGTVFGTPEYMAPEQARGTPLTARADLYSLGCVLYEMLTGRTPFVGSTPDLILAHMREVAQLPSQRAPEVPPSLDAVTMRLLDKDPARRFGDAHHVLDELRRAARELPEAPRLTPLPEEPAELVPSAPTIATQAWEHRATLFERLANEAHPDGPPEWLGDALADLRVAVRELAELRAGLARSAESVIRLEADVRNARLRIGRALDVLAEDESRALRGVEERRTDLARTREALAQIEPELDSAWLRAGVRGPKLRAEEVEALAAAGALAQRWLESSRAIGEKERALARSEQDCDDIRFQIAQLKGRLGTMSAEGELSLRELRDKTGQIDGGVQALLDRIADRSEGIVKHLLTFAELADEVRTTALEAGAA